MDKLMNTHVLMECKGYQKRFPWAAADAGCARKNELYGPFPLRGSVGMLPHKQFEI